MELIAIFTGCLVVLLAVVLLGEQRQIRSCKKRLQELEDREAQDLVAIAQLDKRLSLPIGQLQAVTTDHTKTINAIWTQLDIVRPEEIERRALAGRLDAGYKSLGQIVPNIDGMSLPDLQEAQTVLATLEKWNARPETPEKFVADVERLTQFSLNPMEDTDQFILHGNDEADAAADAAQHPVTPWGAPGS